MVSSRTPLRNWKLVFKRQLTLPVHNKVLELSVFGNLSWRPTTELPMSKLKTPSADMAVFQMFLPLAPGTHAI